MAHAWDIFFIFWTFCKRGLSCLEGCVNKVFERITDDTSSSTGAQSFLRFTIKHDQNGQTNWKFYQFFMYSSWRVTSRDIWTYFQHIQQMLKQWSIQSLVHILKLGLKVLHLNLNFWWRWKQTMTSRMWLDEPILVIKTKERKIELASFCRMRTPLVLRRPAWAVNKAGWR